MSRLIDCPSCGLLKPHRAKGVCDPCYQRQRYWFDPDKHRAAGRRSMRMSRLRNKGVPNEIAKRMSDRWEKIMSAHLEVQDG